MVHTGTKSMRPNLETEWKPVFKFKRFLRLVFCFHTDLFGDLNCL